MKSLNLNKFLITILVLIVIVLGVTFWFKVYPPIADISPEAVEKKCTEETIQMTDDELIGQIDNLKYPEKITGDISSRTGLEHDRKSLTQNLMVEYLICKAKTNPEDKSFYDRAQEYISEKMILGDKGEQAKQEILDSLNSAVEQPFVNFLNMVELEMILEDRERQAKQEVSDSLDGVAGQPFVNFLNIVALGNLEKLCPGELPKICRKSLEDLGEKNQALFSSCDSLCNYKNWTPDLKLEIEDPIEFQSRYQTEVAFAYRFGGSELALLFCDDIKEESRKKDCLNLIKRFNYLQNCDLHKEKLADLICVVD